MFDTVPVKVEDSQSLISKKDVLVVSEFPSDLFFDLYEDAPESELVEVKYYFTMEIQYFVEVFSRILDLKVQHLKVDRYFYDDETNSFMKTNRWIEVDTVLDEETGKKHSEIHVATVTTREENKKLAVISREKSLIDGKVSLPSNWKKTTASGERIIAHPNKGRITWSIVVNSTVLNDIKVNVFCFSGKVSKSAVGGSLAKVDLSTTAPMMMELVEKSKACRMDIIEILFFKRHENDLYATLKNVGVIPSNGMEPFRILELAKESADSRDPNAEN